MSEETPNTAANAAEDAGQPAKAPAPIPDTITFDAELVSGPDAAELERKARAQEKLCGTITADDIKAAKATPGFQDALKKKITLPHQEALAEAIARVIKIRDAQRANAATFSTDVPDGVLAGDGSDGPVRFGTALTDDYPPTFGISPVLTVVTPGSSAATWHGQGIEDYTPPPREYLTHTDTTLTGTLAGKQLVTITVEKASMIQLTQIYGTAHRANLDAFVGVNYCIITLTLNDGSIYAGTGGISKAAESQQGENNSLKTAITISLNGGWTYTVGTNGPTNA